MIEGSIIRQILDAWAASWKPSPPPAFPQRPLPSLHDVKEVFETVFFASLGQEEGRPVRFSVVLASPSDIDDPSHRYNNDFRRFTTPISFTVESIVKLAPAFDPTLSSIAVCRDSATRNLQCWGIFNYSARPQAFSKPSPGPIWGTCFRPDLFTLAARKPGMVQISRMDSNIGLFANGRFIPPVPTPFTSRSPGSYLIRLLDSTDLSRRYGVPYLGLCKVALGVLLSESASRGHGAIIVLLGSGDTKLCEDFISGARSLEMGVPLKTYFEHSLEANKLHRSSSGKLIHEHLQRLAQLSTVDGALILTHELELVAFGAKLTATKWEGKILEGPDGFGNASSIPFPAQLYGARHNSAINFAGACKRSIVFVISQDGPVRAFTWRNEDTVLYWPDLKVSMFVEFDLT